MLARRRGGIAEAQEERVLVAERRPLGTGTTAEAVSTLAFAAAHAQHDHGTVEEEPPPPAAAAPAPAEGGSPPAGGGW